VAANPIRSALTAAVVTAARLGFAAVTVSVMAGVMTAQERQSTLAVPR
jgi:hypothetical protein